MKLTIEDHNEINKLINDGFTSGLLDAEDYRIAWEITDDGIKTNKFKR